MTFQELRAKILAHGYVIFKTTDLRLVFSKEGEKDIVLPKESIIPKGTVKHIEKQLKRSWQQSLEEIKEVIVEAEKPVIEEPIFDADTYENPDDESFLYLSDMMSDVLRKVLRHCKTVTNNKTLTVAELMNAVGQQPHRLTEIIKKVDAKADITTLFLLRETLALVGIEPKPLLEAVARLEALTAPALSAEKVVVKTFQEIKDPGKKKINPWTRKNVLQWHEAAESKTVVEPQTVNKFKPKEEKVDTLKSSQPLNQNPASAPQPQHPPMLQAVLDVVAVLGRFPTLDRKLKILAQASSLVDMEMMDQDQQH